MKKIAMIGVALVSVMVSGLGFAADEPTGEHDRGERLEQHFDNKGDRIEDRFDKRADRAEANGHDNRADRLERRGDTIDKRMDNKGERLENRVDRREERREGRRAHRRQTN